MIIGERAKTHDNIARFVKGNTSGFARWNRFHELAREVIHLKLLVCLVLDIELVVKAKALTAIILWRLCRPSHIGSLGDGVTIGCSIGQGTGKLW